MDEPSRSSPPFRLPPEDEQYLDWFDEQHESSWKRKVEGPGDCKWGLFIENFPIPEGYNRKRSTLMLLIPTGYPGAGLDMFYFHPHLARKDEQEIGALADEGHFATNWQRWSRHYDWNPGEDNIISHVEYVLLELNKEIGQ